jgi:putative heme-binding domain-containing protein
MSIQTAALDGLLAGRGQHVPKVLISHWQGCGPAMRPRMLDALLSRTEWLEPLLLRIESGAIPAGQISAAAQQKLLHHPQSSISERAEKLFNPIESDRRKVVESYKAVELLNGDSRRGELLFKQNCAACHQFAAHPQVGPDLGALANKPVAILVEAILDPNRAVEARYMNYNVLTEDGREVSGIIVAETPSSITLRSSTGEETILRKNIKEMSISGLSLMPEGFERILSAQDLADVIAFITRR